MTKTAEVMAKTSAYPVPRSLDGCFFRVCRDGRWLSLCVTDMTAEERDRFIGKRSAEWWRALALGLADSLRELGDSLDVVRAEGGEDR